MSNEMTLFSDGSNASVPAHLLDGGASDLTKSLAGNTGVKRVSIKGGVFRMQVGSQEVAVNEDRSMKMVIVGAAPGISRTYYEGEYKEGKTVAPVCWSDDGQAPSAEVEAPQAKSCNNCPQNIKGSGKGGSRACRFSARIAVALESDISGGVYGMSIPATSIFGEGNKTHSPLQEYARKLAGYNFSMEKVVTEFKFDTNSPVPKLMFRAVRPLTEEEYEEVKSLASHPDMPAHIGPRKFEKPEDENEEEGTKAEGTADVEEDEAEEPKVAKKKKAEKTEVDADVEDILKEWAED